jgi:polyhydroxyalkanoate synthesis repressor PhaR
MSKATVVVRKYGNRRLYDTSRSRYINLEEIAILVRNGTDVQVLDAKTGEDLTRVTLTQVIVEHAKDQPGSFPLELLRELIVVSDHVGREFITWYLRSAFDAYEKVQGALQTGLSGVGTAATSPLDLLKRLIPGAISKASEVNEIEQLRARLAELESKSRKPKKSPVKKKKATASSR